MELADEPKIDAKTFQEPLWKLAEMMAQQVKREGAEHRPVCGLRTIRLHLDHARA